jgi:hypothetical protein
VILIGLPSRIVRRATGISYVGNEFQAKRWMAIVGISHRSRGAFIVCTAPRVQHGPDWLLAVEYLGIEQLGMVARQNIVDIPEWR